MHINKKELESLKAGLDLIYYCEDMPEKARNVFRAAMATIDKLYSRLAYDNETRALRAKKKYQTKKALTGAHTKKYSVQVGENTPLIYFDDPKEIASLLGVNLRNKYAPGLERELRRALGRPDVWVMSKQPSRLKSDKTASLARKNKTHKGRKRKQEAELDYGGEYLPDLKNDN